MMLSLVVTGDVLEFTCGDVTGGGDRLYSSVYL